MYPETNKSETKEEEILEIKSPYTNAIDAATNGALEGLKLSLNVGAMLITILGLVALINSILRAIGQPLRLSSLSLELIFLTYSLPLLG